MKKQTIITKLFILSVVITILTILFCVSASATVYNGTCGENLTWSLDTTSGELIIDGTGNMASYKASSLIPWYSRRTLIKSVTISEGVTSICDNAFNSCVKLATVSLPSTLTSIGSSAFSSCRVLSAITIPDGVVSIGASAFSTCCAVKSISIPASVTSIGVRPLYGMESLESITVAEENSYYSGEGNCLIDIKNKSVIAGCKNSAIPNDTVKIDDMAFYECVDLQSISIPSGVKAIGSSAFFGCTSLTSITFPDGLTQFGQQVLKNCTALSGSVTLPSCLTSVPYGTFDGCTNLTEVVVPSGIKTIDNYAFNNCSNLKSFTIPSGVTSIGDSAFYNCSKLEGTFSLPVGLKSLGKNAFYNCRSLTGTVTIPEDVTVIGSSTFYDCIGLTGVVFHDYVTQIGGSAFYGCKALTYIDLPDGITLIDVSAFRNCSGLKGNLALPENLTSIGQYAFSGCIGLSGELVIPENVTSIGQRAFASCGGFSGELNISASVSNIGSSAFQGCGGLTSITVSEDNPTYYSVGNCLIETSKKTLILGCKNSELPLESGITAIGNSAFQNCSGLTQIHIPEGVLSIGANAFDGCSGLTTISLPETLTTIGNYAFQSCSSLTGDLVIPDSVTTLGKFSFAACTDLTSVTLSPNAIRVDDSAFNACVGLAQVTIPEGVETIGNNAFGDCKTLTELILPESVSIIGYAAFAHCTSLKYVELPASGVSVGSYAFLDCSALESITMPVGSTVNNNAFEACEKLKEISFLSASSVISSKNSIPVDTIIYGFAGSDANTYANNYSRSFVPFAADYTTVFEFSVTFTPGDSLAGDHLSQGILERKGSQTTKSLAFFYIEGGTGALCVETASGSYLSLYHEDGTPIIIDEKETDIAIVYDNTNETVRYYVNGEIPFVEGEDGLISAIILPIQYPGFGSMNVVSDRLRSTSNVKIKNIYNINASASADCIGFQVNSKDSSSIRILAGLDMLYYGSVGFEVELYSNGILQGTVTSMAQTVFSEILVNGENVSALSQGYRYLTALTISEIDRTDYPSDAEVYFVAKAFTQVGEYRYYGEAKKIVITHDASTKEHSYILDESYTSSK